MSAEHAASAAEVERKSHSILSAVRAGLSVWYALLGGIAAWTIHLMVLVAVVQYTCNASGSFWIIHLTTAVTVAMVAVAIVLAQRLARAEGDESSDSEGGRSRFIGQLGLVIGYTNLALILLEELYAILLASRRCG